MIVVPTKLRRWLVVAADITVFAFSFTAAFLLRFEGELPPGMWRTVLHLLPLVVAARFAAFSLFGCYRGIWRFSSVRDMINLSKGVGASSIVIVLLVVFWKGLVGFPRSVFVVDTVICFLLVGGFRLTIRIGKELFPPKGLDTEGIRTLLVGGGSAADFVIRETKRNQRLHYRIIGIIDDDEEKAGTTLHGIPVLGTTERLHEIVRREGVEEIIVALPSVRGPRLREIIEHCRSTGVSFKAIPEIGDLVQGRVEVSKLRSIQMEDLLPRETMGLDTDGISHYLTGKSVLITGAAGTIGSELARQILSFSPSRLTLLDHDENRLYLLSLDLEERRGGTTISAIIGDIRDRRRMGEVMGEAAPRVVFHAAAHKHVPLMQHQPGESYKNNVLGTLAVAEAAQEAGAEAMVLISTDKAVDPTSIMGATKRIAEKTMQALAVEGGMACIAVRFGNVLGSQGSVIEIFKAQIERGGPVTVTHPEAVRWFMTVSEAVSLVLQAAALGSTGEILFLDMGEQIRIEELARNVITLAGYVPDEEIQIVHTGLRPGEKLAERMTFTDESVRPTSHPKIHRVLDPRAESGGFLRDVRAVRERVEAGETVAWSQLINDQVPEAEIIP